MLTTTHRSRRSPTLRGLVLLLVLLIGLTPGPLVAQEQEPGAAVELEGGSGQALAGLARFAAGRAAPAVSDSLPYEQVRYRITLKQSGIYRLTYTDLNAAGVPLAAIDPRNFRLYRGEEEVAFELVGGDDGRFDPGDLVRFYAPPFKNLLTDVSTFWLFVAPTPAVRMASRSVAPLGGGAVTTYREVTRFEQDKTYRSAMPMLSDVDHWYWGQTSAIASSGVYTLSVTFDLDQPLATGNAGIDIELWGASGDARVLPDHRMRIYVNDTEIGLVEWDGAVATLGSLTFPQSLLKQGQNKLTLYMPADTGARDSQNRLWEVNWLNWFDLSYTRGIAPTSNRLNFTPPAGPAEFESSGWTSASVLLYDVSNPLAPVRLSDFGMSGGPPFALRFLDAAPAGARYVALLDTGPLAPTQVVADQPSNLRIVSQGADYLVISHPGFITGIQPLVEHRRSQGYRVQVVDVQNIYDEFNGGLISYHAIRDFISYAYNYWPAPRPQYVLLVGDGTYDFFNREGYNAKTYIPPFLAAVDPVLGETAADNRYVAVAGDDIMPDLYLGRLPVNNNTELNVIVNKIISYESAPLGGDWRKRSVFVADNPDAGGPFHLLADNSLSHVPADWSTPKIYLGTTEYPANQAALAQTAVLNAYNAGALLFNYVGHASITAWAAELLLSTSSTSSLVNGAALPVMLPMTCLEATYQNPRFAGLSETLLRWGGGGAVASWGPTGLGVASGHDYLHQGFMDALFKQDTYILGQTVHAGQENLYQNARFPDGTPRFRDLIDTYILLGDPAMRVGIPRDVDLEVAAQVSPGPYEPGDVITYTISYQNMGQARAHDVSIAADLSEWIVDLTWSATGPQLTEAPGSPYTWTLPVLGSGESGTITVVGRIDPGAPSAVFPLSAQFNVTSSGNEVDPGDNVAGPLYITIITAVDTADLVLSQDVEPRGDIQPGQQITITLKYHNFGPGVPTGLTIDLPLSFPLEQLSMLQEGPPVTLVPGSQYTLKTNALPTSVGGMITLIGRIPFGVTSQQFRLEIAAKARGALLDPDMSNNVSGPDVLTLYGADQYEPDDAWFEAQKVTLPLSTQGHLYEPMGDEDWLTFEARAGARYLIQAAVPNSSHGVALYVTNLDGAFLDSSDGLDTGGLTQLWWTAPATGRYYLAVSGGAIPSGARYSLSITALPGRVYLPLLINN